MQTYTLFSRVLFWPVDFKVFLNDFERLLKITLQFMANFILYSYLFEYSLSAFILDRIDWRHPTSM